MQFSQSSCEKSLLRNGASSLLNDIIILGNRGTGQLYPRNRGSDFETGWHLVYISLCDRCLPVQKQIPSCL